METRQSIAERVRQLSLELAMEMDDQYDEQEYGSPFEAVEARAAQIGDMLMREIAIARHRLANLSPPAAQSNCPDCQQPCQQSGLRRKKLQTIRGEIEIDEPEYHCHKCRRSFFPDGPMAGG
jgi:hypothetical protein